MLSIASIYSWELEQSCDIVTTIAATPARSALVDFSHPVLYPPVSYLIPKPVSSINVLSVAKPFKLWVKSIWLTIWMYIIHYKNVTYFL